METNKNIGARGEGIVDHSTVIRYFKKFHSSSKNFVNQAKSNRPKTMDSVTKPETNWMSNTWKYKASSASLSSVLFLTLSTSGKASKAAELYLMLPKYCKTFDSL